jgi:hypothetical protein
MSELMPKGVSFVDWQVSQLDDIETAIGGSQ